MELFAAEKAVLGGLWDQLWGALRLQPLHHGLCVCERSQDWCGAERESPCCPMKRRGLGAAQGMGTVSDCGKGVSPPAACLLCLCQALMPALVVEVWWIWGQQSLSEWGLTQPEMETKSSLAVLSLGPWHVTDTQGTTAHAGH